MIWESTLLCFLKLENYPEVAKTVVISFSSVQCIIKKYEKLELLKIEAGQIDQISLLQQLRCSSQCLEKSYSTIFCTISNIQQDQRVKGQEIIISKSNWKRWSGACKCMEFWPTVMSSVHQASDVHQIVKQGAGSVMVWGCMIFDGLGQLMFIDMTMTALVYIDVLFHNLLSRVRELSL